MVNFRRSLVINFFSSSGATLVQFLVSIVIARLLSPSEIGAFSITLVFVNIAQIFRDFGVSSYLQREKDLTPDKIRSAIGLMFTSSWVLALILFSASGFIAEWFSQPDMQNVMRVLAFGFLFIPFGAITNSLLTREFAADKQALVTIAGTASFSITAIALAYNGFSAMSLAWANFANILACAIALAPLRSKNAPWLPSFRGWGRVAHFGTGALLSNCATALNNAIPDILLGKLASASHVGLFSRANSTVSIFTYVAGSTINYGSVSYISKAHHRGEPIAPILSKATSLITGIGWPALTLTALLGNEIVMTLYGSAWLECVPAIPALAATAAISMIFNYTPIALTALGRPYLSAVPIGFTALVRIACIMLLFSGSLQSFSWMIFAATLAATPILLYQQYRYLGYGPAAMLQAITRSAIVSLICAVTCKALLSLHSFESPTVTLIAFAFPLMLTWYLALRMTRHPLFSEIHGLLNKTFRK